jgi:hypothetical protein
MARRPSNADDFIQFLRCLDFMGNLDLDIHPGHKTKNVKNKIARKNLSGHWKFFNVRALQIEHPISSAQNFSIWGLVNRQNLA